MSKPTLAVIGANGRSGRAFVRLALEQGYTVRAGVHSGDVPPKNHMEVVQIDATNPADVQTLLNGSDVVVSLIGHVKGSPAHVHTEATRAVLSAMKELGISQVISLTGTGVRMPGDRPNLIDRAMNTGIKLIDSARVQDGIEHVKLLQDSSAQWTIVRVLKLTNGPAKPFSLTAHGPAQATTSRIAVAEAMLQIIAEQSFARQAPIMSRPSLW